ncbi:hypothetical protein DAEQUDRAFT_739984 [Daedalea quercina L-15889]|uniref:Uncharacterized protein n=1 Tax=Daedalea quercina L-15889 TaxID=1314783 RepID=A0A165N296_9APHY|nr:hypothetical protein DAEQUDRAFT_739984 [Daedalea quercina L-15889]
MPRRRHRSSGIALVELDESVAGASKLAAQDESIALDELDAPVVSAAILADVDAVLPLLDSDKQHESRVWRPPLLDCRRASELRIQKSKRRPRHYLRRPLVDETAERKINVVLHVPKYIHKQKAEDAATVPAYLAICPDVHLLIVESLPPLHTNLLAVLVSFMEKERSQYHRIFVPNSSEARLSLDTAA